MKAIEFSCILVRKRTLAANTIEFRFKSDRPIQFEAGQFMNIVIPNAGPKGRDLKRPYSIASAPELGELELCIKLIENGKASVFLNGLNIGDQIKAFAPYGHFVYVPDKERHACFVSTGTGIAPYRSILFSDRYKENQPKSVTCIFGVRHENELLYDSEFSQISGLDWKICISRPINGWTGFHGRVTDYIKKFSDKFNWTETEFYLCGNGAMIKELRTYLLGKGVEKKSIHLEIYFTPKS